MKTLWFQNIPQQVKANVPPPSSPVLTSKVTPVQESLQSSLPSSDQEIPQKVWEWQALG